MINRITNDNNCDLMVEMRVNNSEEGLGRVKYTDFKVANESEGYAMTYRRIFTQRLKFG